MIIPGEAYYNIVQKIVDEVGVPLEEVVSLNIAGDQVWVDCVNSQESFQAKLRDHTAESLAVEIRESRDSSDSINVILGASGGKIETRFSIEWPRDDENRRLKEIKKETTGKHGLGEGTNEGE